jgi:hypothetical protein
MKVARLDVKMYYVNYLNNLRCALTAPYTDLDVPAFLSALLRSLRRVVFGTRYPDPRKIIGPAAEHDGRFNISRDIRKDVRKRTDTTYHRSPPEKLEH